MIVRRILVILLCLGASSCGPLWDRLGLDSAGPPSALDVNVSPAAWELIKDAREGISVDGIPSILVDHHFHLGGLGTDVQRVCPEIQRSGAWMNADYKTWSNPYLRAKYEVFLNSVGVTDKDNADAQFLNRILDLVNNSGLRRTYLLYALDHRYERPGDSRPNMEGTDLYVANDYMLDVARCLTRKNTAGSVFEPVASIHPYRADAIEELKRMADAGVRYLKWLPPAQNIRPDDPHLIPFYKILAERKIVLLSHTGDEHTFRVIDQDLADPQRLLLALESGVTVVMLHSGREGEKPKGVSIEGQPHSYFDRFVAMMHDDRFVGRLFGELAAVPYLKTDDKLEVLITDPMIRCRLVDGSDYPLAGTALVNPTAGLLSRGFLTHSEDKDDEGPARVRKEALDEIRRYNPILFDFVLKRTIRVRHGKQWYALPASTFLGIEAKIENHSSCL